MFFNNCKSKIVLCYFLAPISRVLFIKYLVYEKNASIKVYVEQIRLFRY